MKTYQSHSADDTREIAHEFSQTLKGGDVVSLTGDLGSGKTTFMQGVANALEINHPMQSPTFLLIKSHTLTHPKRGIHMLYHLDLYRIDGSAQGGELGLSDFLGKPDTITCIEWANKLADELPKHTRYITFTYLSDGDREISISDE